MTENELLGLLAGMTSDPVGTANKIDAAVVRLQALSASLRAQARNPFANPGGTSDRVLMKVVGPDGNVSQSVDSWQK